MSANSFKLEPGRTISHFRLEKLLGEGGMGAVYLAEDLTLSRRVAIKFMRRQMLATLPNPEYRKKVEQRFIREAKSAASINHPNIAQIYEAFFETDHWYIAMEFINGRALDEKIMEDGPLKPDKALEVLEQTIHGLEYAWDSYKIIHRDIKPQNLMLNERESVKIVDLGLAKPIIDSSEEELELTGAGVPVGTPYYMAPEQAAGGDVNHQVDIFALGATIYELLTGKKCFQGKTPPMIYNKQINKDYLPLTDFGVPEDISKLIDKMLEPNVSERYTEYGHILTDIKRIQKGGVQDNSITMMQTVDASMVDSSGNSASMFGTVITGDMHENVQTIIDVFYPIDFKILDRYRILKVIGRGNSGVVYHCMDTQLERECSVKSVKSGREYSPLVFPRIKKNYIKLSAKKHDNLVEVQDIQESPDGEELFIVMELLKGRNLLQYANSITHLNENVALEPLLPILMKIAQALDSVNREYQIVHNDLKPVSIFISESEEIKLLDYGVTYLHRENDPNANDPDIWKHPIANPDYMSPELWQHEKPNMSADQYSLAVIIYEIISHKLPFWMKEMRSSIDPNADTMLGLLEKQFKRVQEEPPNEIEHLSASQNKALLKALSKTSGDRYPASENFISALSGVSTATGKSNKLLLIVAAIIILGGIAVGGILTFKKGKSQSSMDVAENVNNVMLLLKGNTSEDMTDYETAISEAKLLMDSEKFDKAKERYDKIHQELNELYGKERKVAKSSIENRKTDIERLKEDIDKYIRKDSSLTEVRDKLNLPEYAKDADLKTLLTVITAADELIAEAGKSLNNTRAMLSENKDEMSKRLKTLEEAWPKQIGDEPLTEDNKKIFDDSIKKAKSHLQNESFKTVKEELDKAEFTLNTTVSGINTRYSKKLNVSKADLLKVKKEIEPILYFLEGAENTYKEFAAMDKEWKDAEKAKQLKVASQSINSQISKMEALKKRLETTAKTNFIRNIEKTKSECNELKSSIEPLKDLVKEFAAVDSDFKKAESLLTAKNFKEASSSFSSLKESLGKISSRLNEILKNKVNELNEEVIKINDRLSKNKDLNSQISFEISEFEVNYSLARAKKAEREYRAAYDELKKLIETGKSLEKQIKELSSPKIGKDWSVPKLNMKFVWIEKMKVWVGKYEVTNGQYRKFKPAFKNAQFANGKTLNGDNQPLSLVSFKEANEYCAWMNRLALASGSLPKDYVYRLPTREEWVMFATSGNPKFTYPWGNKFPPPEGIVPNFGEEGVMENKAPNWADFRDGTKLTSPVEKTWTNAWKINGTAGNVWEWSLDSQGPKQAIFGASWSSFNLEELKTQPENNFVPATLSFDNIGFRIILAPLIK